MRINADDLYLHLLADLGKHIDVQAPSWAPDSTLEQVRCYCLRDSLLKKFNEEDRPSTSACAAAMEKFLSINNRCGSWSPFVEHAGDEMIDGELKRIIDDFWFVGGVSPLISDLREVFLEGRSGPGAGILARGMDMYTKMFDSPLSYTGDLLELWERCTSIKDSFRLAELCRRMSHGCTEVDASRYSFVNKTTTVARGICTEPTINMWFQLGVGRMLEKRLSSFFGIRLDQQPDRNRWLAQAGSKDNRLVTIDLESASDSLSLRMLKEILPPSFMGVLKLFRCGRTLLPTGSVLELNMVSTMGNGFTFPLQTMLFSAIVAAVAKVSGIKLTGAVVRDSQLVSGNFGVFGDDIICPREIYPRVYRTLTRYGFLVNSSKTFVEGPFRESCGADFYLGENVRGVYLKQLSTKQDRYVAINLLNRWTAKTQIGIPSCVQFLYSSIRNPLHVPLDENDDAGVHTPLRHLPVTSRVGTTKRGTYSYLCSRPQEYCFYILGDVIWTFKEQVRRNYNSYGLLLTFLYGGIRGYRITLRQRVVRYVTKRKSTPRWDYLLPRPLEGLMGSSRSKHFVDAWDRNF